MTQNNELYEHLFAVRVVYQDTYDNEINIIRQLKIYLIDSVGTESSEINQTIYNFYQYFDIPITIETIQQISITPEPAINNLTDMIFNTHNHIQSDNQYTNNQYDLINQINYILSNINHPPLNPIIPNNEENNEENNEDYDDMDLHQSQDGVNIPPINLHQLQDGVNLPPINNINNINNIIYHNISPINSNCNIINILNSLIVNLNSIDISINQLPNLQDVIITVDDEDVNNLNTIILNHDIETNCSICMGSMIKDETVTTLKCNHLFHNDCIIPYLKEYNYKCPVCRTEVGKPKYNI